MRILVFLSLFFCLISGYSQKTRTIPLIDGNYEAKVEIYIANPQIKPNLTKTYAWFKSKKVHYTQGSFEGVLLHGKYVSFHNDQQLKEEGSFKNGLRDGLWKEWYPDGTLKETTNWSAGFRHGPNTVYNTNGRKQIERHFKGDELNGNWILYQEGKEDSIVKYKRGKALTPKTRQRSKGGKKSKNPTEDEVGKFKPFKSKPKEEEDPNEKKDPEKNAKQKAKKSKKANKKVNKSEEKESENDPEK